MQSMLRSEHGGMNEVLADVYADDGPAEIPGPGDTLLAPGHPAPLEKARTS
jgi:hypothetical protein